MRKRRRDYSLIKYDDLPEKQEAIDRIRNIGRVLIDRSVFHKTPAEKLRLKELKANEKADIVKKKRCRPGKEQRERLWLRKNRMF